MTAPDLSRTPPAREDAYAAEAAAQDALERLVWRIYLGFLWGVVGLLAVAFAHLLLTAPADFQHTIETARLLGAG